MKINFSKIFMFNELNMLFNGLNISKIGVSFSISTE